MGVVYNRSSQDVWVVNTDSGPAIANILSPGRRSPSGVDADGVKGRYSSISGHSSWWKAPGPSLPDIYDDGGSLRISCTACYRVAENEFGNVTFKYDSGWGETITSCLFTEMLVDTMGLPDDGSEMSALRRLRDYLSTSSYGSLLIKEYENVSTPLINELSLHPEKEKIIKEVAAPITMEVVEGVNKKEYQQAIDAWRKLRSQLETTLQIISS